MWNAAIFKGILTATLSKHTFLWILARDLGDFYYCKSLPISPNLGTLVWKVLEHSIRAGLRPPVING